MKKELEGDKTMKDRIILKTDKGCFDVRVNEDKLYSGIDVEFIVNNDDGQDLSRPRVLFEYPADGTLRVLVWDNKDSEDYTREIVFNI